ncbi:hypothetical protein VOLCADRAFT_104511, partial [Volvox carteri f. nagariensis]
MGPHTGDAQELVDFLNAAWTPFHAVDEARKMLLAAGFKHLQEKDAWDINPGGRYFFTRNATTIVAFAVGKKYAPGNGFYMIGAHTDSPCLKLKPVSKSTKSDCLMLNVETYGGGLWSTWFDRELGVAGRVLVRHPDTGMLAQRLVKISKPIARIPMLAIHLQTASERSEGFKINAQNHLAPLLATNTKAKAKAPTAPQVVSAAAAAAAAAPAAPPPPPAPERHHPLLLSLLADHLGCSASDIVDLELHMCDVQPSVIGGACEEFIFSGRLDNLAMSFCALTALIRSCGGGSGSADLLAEESGVRAVALFDHEEVGSGSAQ